MRHADETILEERAGDPVGLARALDPPREPQSRPSQSDGFMCQRHGRRRLRVNGGLVQVRTVRERIHSL